MASENINKQLLDLLQGMAKRIDLNRPGIEAIDDEINGMPHIRKTRGGSKKMSAAKKKNIIDELIHQFKGGATIEEVSESDEDVEESKYPALEYSPEEVEDVDDDHELFKVSEKKSKSTKVAKRKKSKYDEAEEKKGKKRYEKSKAVAAKKESSDKRFEKLVGMIDNLEQKILKKIDYVKGMSTTESAAERNSREESELPPPNLKAVGSGISVEVPNPIAIEVEQPKSSMRGGGSSDIIEKFRQEIRDLYKQEGEKSITKIAKILGLTRKKTISLLPMIL